MALLGRPSGGGTASPEEQRRLSEVMFSCGRAARAHHRAFNLTLSELLCGGGPVCREAAVRSLYIPRHLAGLQKVRSFVRVTSLSVITAIEGEPQRETHLCFGPGQFCVLLVPNSSKVERPYRGALSFISVRRVPSRSLQTYSTSGVQMNA